MNYKPDPGAVENRGPPKRPSPPPPNPAGGGVRDPDPIPRPAEPETKGFNSIKVALKSSLDESFLLVSLHPIEHSYYSGIFYPWVYP